MPTFGDFHPSYIHWIPKDKVVDKDKFTTACKALYPNDESGQPTVEICFDVPERPDSIKVTSLSRDPVNLLEELQKNASDNGLKLQEADAKKEKE